MRFLTPMAFWFAAVVPVIILFYLLKRRRHTRLVSSTLLWRRYLAEQQASSPFQRLRHNWLLLLQLLLVALAILALAQPFLARDSHPGRLQVLILDGSASMQATDVTPTRFDSARNQALQRVEGLEEGSQMLVVLAGANTELRQSQTADKSALRHALASCRPGDTSTRLADAIRLAETLTRDHPDAETHLFSDGAAPDLADFEGRTLRLIFHPVGTRSNNQGVVALDARPNPENPRQRAVLASVANFSSNQVNLDVLLLRDGKELETRNLNLAGRETQALVFLADQPPAQPEAVFTVRLKVQDDLAVDNEASVISRATPTLRIMLLTRGNRFLEKALRASGEVELTVVPALPDPLPTPVDILVVDNLQPALWPPVNTLSLVSAPPGALSGATRLEGPTIVDWRHAHPILRFVHLDNIQIGEAVAPGASPWATPLIDAASSPLALAGDWNHQRLVWLGFDLLQSTWPLRVSFPIFIANTIEWLNPASALPSSVRAGDPIHLALPQPVQGTTTNLPSTAASVLEVTGPDGSRHRLEARAGEREWIFGATDHRGVYRFADGRRTLLHAVNLLDPLESDLSPRSELRLGKHAGIQATVDQKTNRALWRWFAAAALAVLSLEWWYFHRRTA